jgi:tyrosyl-tRNA synthetase
MSIPDELMSEWFQLLTDRPREDIRKLTGEDVESGNTIIHPMEAKKTLARDIVAFYHGKDGAIAAQAEWVKQFSQKKDPDDVQVANVPQAELVHGQIGIVKLLVVIGLAKSNNEARQKVTEGAVSSGPDRSKVTDPKAMIAVSEGLVIRLGSRHIRRLHIV